VGLTRLQGIVCRFDLRTIGLSAAHRRALFPSPVTLPRIDRPPVLANRVHSLVPHLPFGVSSSGLLAPPFGVAVLPGFHPSSRRHRWRPRARAFPGSRYVAVLRLSQPLDGLRHRRLCGFITPRSHVQGYHRSGDSPAAQPSWLVASPCPRVVVVRALTGKPAATPERLDFEALLRAVMRSSGSGFSLPCGRSPLRFRPPSGPGYPSWSRFPGASTRDVSGAVFSSA